MKKIVITFLFIAISFLINAQSSVNYTNAVKFNDAIVDYQMGIKKYMDTFINAVVSKNFEAGEIERINFIKSSKEKTASVNLMKGNFKGADEFRKAAIALFNFYALCGENEFKELAILFKGKFTEEDIKKIKALQDAITQKEKEFDAAFLGAQKKFAELNGFKIESSKQ